MWRWACRYFPVRLVKSISLFSVQWYCIYIYTVYTPAVTHASPIIRGHCAFLHSHTVGNAEVTLKATSQLPAEKGPYIFVCHPHGVLASG